MAYGAPVFAQRAGGALDFIDEGRSGLFFDRPEVDDLADAMARFEEKFELDPAALAQRISACPTCADISCAALEQIGTALPLAHLDRSKQMPLGRIRMALMIFTNPHH
jgi:glycosyltransferase involved in cell wall biosynthesis